MSRIHCINFFSLLQAEGETFEFPDIESKIPNNDEVTDNVLEEVEKMKAKENRQKSGYIPKWFST